MIEKIEVTQREKKTIQDEKVLLEKKIIEINK